MTGLLCSPKIGMGADGVVVTVPGVVVTLPMEETIVQQINPDQLFFKTETALTPRRIMTFVKLPFPKLSPA